MQISAPTVWRMRLRWGWLWGGGDEKGKGASWRNAIPNPNLISFPFWHQQRVCVWVINFPSALCIQTLHREPLEHPQNCVVKLPTPRPPISTPYRLAWSIVSAYCLLLTLHLTQYSIHFIHTSTRQLLHYRCSRIIFIQQRFSLNFTLGCNYNLRESHRTSNEMTTYRITTFLLLIVI